MGITVTTNKAFATRRLNSSVRALLGTIRAVASPAAHTADWRDDKGLQPSFAYHSAKLAARYAFERYPELRET